MYLFIQAGFLETVPKNALKNKKIKKILELEPGFPVFRKTVAAIDRAAFCWFKRHFAFFPTV
jgi:hypothetical protein